MDLKETLKTLLKPAILSGMEYQRNDYIKNMFNKYCDELKSDRLGNVIGLKKGYSSKYKVMIAAHMDEVGLIVKDIDDNGFIKFGVIGGVDKRILLGQQVVIHGDEDILGIIGNKPPHIQQVREREKSIKCENMFIDTGLAPNDVCKHISVGDFISFKKSAIELLNSHISSNGLDDRAGIAAMLYALNELKKINHSVDVYAVATIQEEIGLKGAIVSSYEIYPDIGIAIDVCHGDTPDAPEYDTQKLGSGPSISLGPNIHPKLYERLKHVAEDYKIPYQINPEPASTGTDAWAMQITREGIPTALISIPLRYMHSTVETVNLEDIKMAGRLLALFIGSICNDFVEGLQCY